MRLTPGQYVLRKLPHITALFWALKILATTLGETAGDYFSQTLGLGTLRSACLLLAVFLVAVTIQLRASRFHPALFWTVVVLTSTAGTTISDYINYTSHLGQLTGVLILGSGLAVVMLVWWRSGQTLNVENVATLSGEVLFWIAVVFSNSLGTSTGDYLAGGLDLGLRPAALMLTAAMLLLLAAHYFTKLNAMLLFWIAFILTRPWGAEVGNILSRSPDRGGVGWGNAGASSVLIAGLVVLVAYQTFDIHRNPLRPLPLPANRHTGQPQRPNGKVVTIAAA
ncbi:membrane protein [Mycolicibacterium aromaticivorans JS19b1 = JCM 16368]|uniref:Membrane protein n=1 Tax=Mycolicibacterium aromaticivorans JS19b1 = JCM 16368 TaxID=1440774 RepID=A0A064CTF4_9MYCO|nr:membrane protein [Mycolicibacterium aromaticivorans]KDF01999.1 membrane protein [Mycolicibacterium aromaticivorans JS19b1 = JCM 16368]